MNAAVRGLVTGRCVARVVVGGSHDGQGLEDIRKTTAVTGDTNLSFTISGVLLQQLHAAALWTKRTVTPGSSRMRVPE